MRLLALAIMSLAWGTAFAATVYKWVDENGVTHYSDQPYPGAKKLEIESAQTYSAPPTPAAAAARPNPSPAAGPIYTECALYRPSGEEVLFNTSTVEAKLRLAPELRAGDKVTIALDGKRMADVAVTDGNATVTSVPRGRHVILAVVEDLQGTVVCQTPPVTFYVRQASKLSPQSPTATPKPPPRRRP